MDSTWFPHPYCISLNLLFRQCLRLYLRRRQACSTWSKRRMQRHLTSIPLWPLYFAKHNTFGARAKQKTLRVGHICHGVSCFIQMTRHQWTMEHGGGWGICARAVTPQDSQCEFLCEAGDAAWYKTRTWRGLLIASSTGPNTGHGPMGLMNFSASIFTISPLSIRHHSWVSLLEISGKILKKTIQTL
jgi:hypothetical protein